MSEFTFNNYSEFGLFLKINSEEIKGLNDSQIKSLLQQSLKDI